MSDAEVLVSVVMPCLDEEETLGACIRKARAALDEGGWSGEVVVADNGSTDRSREVAREHGARVVEEEERGYGAAYQTGLGAARGRFIVIGDSDDSYDFSELGRFIRPLEEGYEFVMGHREEVRDGAMPWLHRYFGNPLLSRLLNWFFDLEFSDVYCGMRGFTREAYDRMRLDARGMEFALQMVVNASWAGLRTTEVPITLHPRAGESKLRTFRDGWRSLRFMLLYSPTYLYLVPGTVLVVAGAGALTALLTGPLAVAGIRFDYHWMFPASGAVLLGFQLLLLGLYAKTYGMLGHFVPEDRWLHAFHGAFTLERGLLVGGSVAAVGAGTEAAIFLEWLESGFGTLFAVRPAVFGLTLFLLGVEVCFASFFLSLLRMEGDEP